MTEKLPLEELEQLELLAEKAFESPEGAASAELRERLQEILGTQGSDSSAEPREAVEALESPEGATPTTPENRPQEMPERQGSDSSAEPLVAPNQSETEEPTATEPQPMSSEPPVYATPEEIIQAILKDTRERIRSTWWKTSIPTSVDFTNKKHLIVQ